MRRTTEVKKKFHMSEKGHLEVARLLIENKATVDLPNASGATALVIASKEDHLEVAELIREALENQQV